MISELSQSQAKPDDQKAADVARGGADGIRTCLTMWLRLRLVFERRPEGCWNRRRVRLRGRRRSAKPATPSARVALSRLVVYAMGYDIHDDDYKHPPARGCEMQGDGSCSVAPPGVSPHSRRVCPPHPRAVPCSIDPRNLPPALTPARPLSWELGIVRARLRGRSLASSSLRFRRFNYL